MLFVQKTKQMAVRAAHRWITKSKFGDVGKSQTQPDPPRPCMVGAGGWILHGRTSLENPALLYIGLPTVNLGMFKGRSH